MWASHDHQPKVVGENLRLKAMVNDTNDFHAIAALPYAQQFQQVSVGPFEICLSSDIVGIHQNNDISSLFVTDINAPFQWTFLMIVVGFSRWLPEALLWCWFSSECCRGTPKKRRNHEDKKDAPKNGTHALITIELPSIHAISTMQFVVWNQLIWVVAFISLANTTGSTWYVLVPVDNKDLVLVVGCWHEFSVVVVSWV